MSFLVYSDPLITESTQVVSVFCFKVEVFTLQESKQPLNFELPAVDKGQRMLLHWSNHLIFMLTQTYLLNNYDDTTNLDNTGF